MTLNADDDFEQGTDDNTDMLHLGRANGILVGLNRGVKDGEHSWIEGAFVIGWICLCSVVELIWTEANPAGQP